MTIHVNSPTALEVNKYFRCRICKRRRLHAVKCFEWYTWTAHCKKCGEEL